MNKKLFALLMVLVLLMSVVFTGCNSGNKNTLDEDEVAKDPGEQISISIDKTMEAMESASVSAFLEEALESGKVTISFADVLDNVLYINAEDGVFADTLTINDGENEVSIELYGKGNEFAIASPMFGDNKAYGVNLDTAKEDLKDSAIWSVLGTDYDTFMSQYSDVVDELVSIVDEVDSEEYTEKINKMAEELVAVFEDVEVSTEKGTIDVDGEDVEAINVTYHLTGEDLEKILTIYIDCVEDVTTDLLSNLSSFAVEGEDIGTEDMAVVFDELRSSFETAFEGAEISADVIVSINPDNQCIMRMAIEGEVSYEGYEEEKVIFELECVLGKDPATSDRIYVKGEATSGGESIGFDIDLKTTTKDDVTTTKLSMAVSGAGEEMEAAFTIEHDVDTNEYVASFEADDEELLSVEGEYEFTDKTFAFSVDSITVDGEPQELGLRIAAEVISADEIPAMPEYTNILTMSEDELIALLSQMELPEMPDIQIPDSPVVDYPDIDDEPIEIDPVDPPVSVTPGGGNLANDSVVLYEDEDFTLTATGVDKDDYGWNLYVSLENRTEHEIGIGCDAASVNGIAIEPYSMIEIGPNETVSGYFCFDKDDYAPAVINEIGYIYADHVWIYEKDEYSTLCEFAFRLDIKEGVKQTIDKSGNVIFDSNNVQIIAKGDLTEDYSEYMTTVIIVNGRDEAVSVDMDNFTVNGEDVDDFGFPTVPANCVMYYTLGFWADDCPVDMDEIETVTFDVSLCDKDYDDIGATEEVTINFD